MCTDLRLVRLNGLHVSGRTMDFTQELGSRVQVVPAGNSWSATETGTAVTTLTWTNTHGYVAMDAFGFDWAACDGLNDADLIHFGSWVLDTCATVQDVRDAFAGVQVWNAPPFGASGRTTSRCRTWSGRCLTSPSPCTSPSTTRTAATSWWSSSAASRSSTTTPSAC